LYNPVSFDKSSIAGSEATLRKISKFNIFPDSAFSTSLKTKPLRPLRSLAASEATLREFFFLIQ
jgi:hypothetical protein